MNFQKVENAEDVFKRAVTDKCKNVRRNNKSQFNKLNEKN